MKAQRLVIGLTAVNFVFALIVLAQGGSAAPRAQQSVVRTKALELVDGRGLIRAKLSVEGGGALFRMRDAKGTIRVKLGGDENGSGLLLANDATEVGFHALANRDGTRLTLKDKGGRPRIIKPRP